MELISNTTRRSDGKLDPESLQQNPLHSPQPDTTDPMELISNTPRRSDGKLDPESLQQNPLHSPQPNTTAAASFGLFGLLCSLGSISTQVLHGFECFRCIATMLQLLWVLVVCSVPVLLCVSIRFLFAPSSSIGAVSISSFTWYLACFVATATVVYGFRLTMREYLKTRFSHRAQISVARAVASGNGSDFDVIGHHIRAARNCVLEDIPAMCDGVLQTIVFTIISLTQSTSIGAGSVLVLLVLFVVHLLDDALQTSSMQKLHRLQKARAGHDPVAAVHQLAAETHTQSMYRAVLITISVLVEFSSPLVFLYCCVGEMKTVHGNGGVVEEFNLFLSFISAVASIVASKATHAASRRTLSKIHSVRVLSELGLGRGEKHGWKSTTSNAKSGKDTSCTAKTGILTLFIVVVTVTIATLIATGSQVDHIGCSNVQIECVLGESLAGAITNAATLHETQMFDLATGCKIKSDGRTLLERCLIASAVSSGYGEVSFNNNTERTNQTSRNDAPVQTIVHGNFTEEQVLRAASGKTASQGGLNLEKIRSVLAMNGMSTSGVRTTLEKRLQTLLGDNTADTTSNGFQYVIEDENSGVDTSIRSMGELLLDGPNIEVTLSVRYHNWLNEIETIQSTITWQQVAEVAAKLNAEDVQDIDEMQDDEENAKELTTGIENHRRQLATLSTSAASSIHNEITFSKRVTSSKKSGTTNYVVHIVVGSKRSAGSRNTISVQLVGEFGSTESVVLGDQWIPDEKREVLLPNMVEVGDVTAVTLVTSGKDGVLFESVTVNHLETAVVAAKTVNPTTTTATTTTAIEVGSKVLVTTGKYTNCPGVVELFSPTTGKPQVCRDCSKQTAGKGKNGDCCSSSTCGYYQVSSLERVVDAIVASDATAR